MLQAPVFECLSFDPFSLQQDGLPAAEVRRASGIDDFIWHGVRHLAETKTAELKDDDGKTVILPYVRDMLFDHASARGTGGVYDHHAYVPEMRDALEAWAAYVKKLVGPSKHFRDRMQSSEDDPVIVINTDGIVEQSPELKGLRNEDVDTPEKRLAAFDRARQGTNPPEHRDK